MERAAPDRPRSAPVRRDRLHGHHAGKKPRSPGDLAGLHRRRRGHRAQQLADQRGVAQAQPGVGQSLEVRGAVLAAGYFRRPADRLPPRPVDSRRPARELDIPPHREPGPQAVDVGGGAFRHLIRNRANLRAAVSGGGPHSGLAAGSTHDGAASVSLVHDFRAAVLQLAATPVHLFVRPGKASADRHRGRVPRGARRGRAAALPDHPGRKRIRAAIPVFQRRFCRPMDLGAPQPA